MDSRSISRGANWGCQRSVNCQVASNLFLINSIVLRAKLINTHLRSVGLTVAEKYLSGLWRIKIKIRGPLLVPSIYRYEMKVGTFNSLIYSEKIRLQIEKNHD